MQNIASILKKYNEAFLTFSHETVIDLDKKKLPKFSFQVYRLEDRLRELNGIVPLNRQSQYFIALIEKGQGTKTIGLSQFPIVDNLLMIIPERVIHGGTYTSQDYSGYVLSFSLDFFLNKAFPRHLITNKLIFKKSRKPYLALTEIQSKELKSIFESIIRESAPEASTNRDEMMVIKVLELIISCDRYFGEAQLTGQDVVYPDMVTKFNNLVDEHFISNRSVQYFADVLSTHPNNLNAVVRKYSGMSAKQVINSKIINEAILHLTDSALSVKEISNLLGFDDPNYFSYFFKKETKSSPVQYRRIRL